MMSMCCASGRGENIMLQNQRIMLCSDAHNLCQLCSTNKQYAFNFSRLVNRYTSLTTQTERSTAFSRGSMLSGSSLVLLKLSEASSPESSTSSPSLETVVNLVPETKATGTPIGLVAFGLSSYVETAHAQYTRG